MPVNAVCSDILKTMVFSNTDVVYMAKGYFENDLIEKEFLQHALFESTQKMREVMLVDHEMEISMRELYIDQLKWWQHREHYAMCQLIMDSAERYEIDMNEFGLDI
jgi:hypothetical protein